jgi:hypothetical protein
MHSQARKHGQKVGEGVSVNHHRRMKAAVAPFPAADAVAVKCNWLPPHIQGVRVLIVEPVQAFRADEYECSAIRGFEVAESVASREHLMRSRRAG